MIKMDECVLTDLLECSVCLDQLDSTSKVLPCQHTFCKRCLEEIISSRKELRCPECRVLVETKVEELPSNILLIRILEGMKNAPRNRALPPPPVPPPSSQVAAVVTVGSWDVTRVGSGGGGGGGRPQPPIPSALQAILQRPSQQGSAENNHHHVSMQAVPKQSGHVQPCARALYSYEAKEAGDLSFKKDDIIILRKKIDQNWYHGELCGKHGFFPASYVRVITPLPAHMPQCKATYDFRMSENEEKDCLAFSKGDVITVIRRVDENWAEGKLGDRIGIFPITFVEMNGAARSLMKLSTNFQSGPSRVAPPTPSSDSDTTPLITPNNTGGINVHSTVSTSSSSPSSSSSTSTSASSSSSSSASTPTSPPVGLGTSSSSTAIPHRQQQQQQQQQATCLLQQQQQHQREKRHSLVASGSLSRPPPPPLPATHRYSVEIPSNTLPNLLSSISLVPTPVVQPRHKLIPQSGSVSEGGTRQPDGIACSSTPNLSTSNGSLGSPQTHVSVPIFYVALYPYKPQKEDELELRKGELYTVSEKCQDGWFKGTSLRTSQSGVFPGNYVQAAKSSLLQAHFRQTSSSLANVRPTSSRVPSNAHISNSICTSRSHSSSSPSSASTSNTNGGRSNDSSLSRARAAAAAVSERTQGFLEWARSVTAIAVPPKSSQQNSHRYHAHTSPRLTETRSVGVPDLPPRVVNYNPEVSSCSVTQPATSNLLSPQPAISQSWHGTPSTPQQQVSPSVTTMSRSLLSATAAAMTPPPNASVSGTPATSESSTTPEVSVSNHSHRYEKVKRDKKDRKPFDKVSFVKRLTIKKKLKSPMPCAYSMDNPVFVDCTPSSSTGSVTSVTNPHPIHVRSESCPSDVVFTATPPSHGGGGHRKSNSIDGSTDSTCVTNIKASRPKQPAPLVRERFRCIVPYPPNSEHELELKIGDVIYVHKKRDDGWYKGTLNRTGKTGLFPGSFVETF